MTNKEVKEKVLLGTRLAIQRLIKKKQLEDSYLVVSDDNCKVVEIRARDITIGDEKKN